MTNVTKMIDSQAKYKFNIHNIYFLFHHRNIIINNHRRHIRTKHTIAFCTYTAKSSN